MASLFSKALCKTTGHKWVGCKCSRCGETRDEGHTFQQTEGKCEQRCSVCEKTEKLSHQWNGSVCTRCGAIKGIADKLRGFSDKHLSFLHLEKKNNRILVGLAIFLVVIFAFIGIMTMLETNDTQNEVFQVSTLPDSIQTSNTQASNNNSGNGNTNTSTSAYSTQEEASIELDNKVKSILGKNYKVGDTVKLGIYDKFADGSGNDKDIEWEVIKIDEDNQRILLRCIMIIDGQPYNKVAEETTWENCSLRKWLNEDFLMRAFSESERYIIAETTFMYDDIEVIDKVFLPSYEEAYDSKALEVNRRSTGSYRAKATSYAFKQGVTLYSEFRWSPPVRTQRNNFYYNSDDKWAARYESANSYCSWWLRPTKNNSTSTEIIDGWGSYETVNVEKYDSLFGMRPAVWLDMSIN